jgi:hypothetical protein
MFHERLVPRKSKNKRTDKDREDEHKNFSKDLIQFFSVCEVSEHFTYY